MRGQITTDILTSVACSIDPDDGREKMVKIYCKTALGLFNNLTPSNTTLPTPKFILLTKNGESASLGSIISNLAKENAFITFHKEGSEETSTLTSARILLGGHVEPGDINDELVIIEKEECLKGTYFVHVYSVHYQIFSVSYSFDGFLTDQKTNQRTFGRKIVI